MFINVCSLTILQIRNNIYLAEVATLNIHNQKQMFSYFIVQTKFDEIHFQMRLNYKFAYRRNSCTGMNFPLFKIVLLYILLF